jgi:hypothetical protein
LAGRFTSLIPYPGLLSLAVEFYRQSGSLCPGVTPQGFQYGTTSCGFVCSTTEGPVSPIRGGSGNNIDVVPAPQKITFNAAMLIAAACCIPAILLLIWLLIKIFETGPREDPVAPGKIGDNAEQPAPSFKRIFRSFQGSIEVPLFGAAIFAIVVMGEMNLWSTQVQYDTEPMGNVGE